MQLTPTTFLFNFAPGRSSIVYSRVVQQLKCICMRFVKTAEQRLQQPKPPGVDSSEAIHIQRRALSFLYSLYTEAKSIAAVEQSLSLCVMNTAACLFNGEIRWAPIKLPRRVVVLVVVGNLLNLCPRFTRSDGSQYTPADFETTTLHPPATNIQSTPSRRCRYIPHRVYIHSKSVILLSLWVVAPHGTHTIYGDKTA